ncbi:MAG: hypothetical protein ACFLMY_09905 [Candidatus Brachytrichaceae bacterium NZ_4S206]|jgi:hypothetical protein
MNPGSIVLVRNHCWVLLPHPDLDVYALRSLTGMVDETLTLRLSQGEAARTLLPLH